MESQSLGLFMCKRSTELSDSLPELPSLRQIKRFSVFEAHEYADTFKGVVFKLKTMRCVCVIKHGSFSLTVQWHVCNANGALCVVFPADG